MEIASHSPLLTFLACTRLGRCSTKSVELNWISFCLSSLLTTKASLFQFVSLLPSPPHTHCFYYSSQIYLTLPLTPPRTSSPAPHHTFSGWNPFLAFESPLNPHHDPDTRTTLTGTARDRKCVVGWPRSCYKICTGKKYVGGILN